MRNYLLHPLMRGQDVEAPGNLPLKRRMIREKPFLRRIYEDWYRIICESISDGPGSVLELGSGPGFLQDYIPRMITSEVFPCSTVMLVADGHRLPFASGSLRAIVMTDVLHHMSRPRDFLAEAARCVRAGGVIAAVEPWVSSWSRIIYRRFHYEPFEPEAEQWEFRRGSANNALPWILFDRDRERFEREFPQWEVEKITPIHPFRYLLSGGIRLRSLMPAFSYPVWCAIEKSLQPWMSSLAMFASILIRRKGNS